MKRFTCQANKPGRPSQVSTENNIASALLDKMSTPYPCSWSRPAVYPFFDIYYQIPSKLIKIDSNTFFPFKSGFFFTTWLTRNRQRLMIAAGVKIIRMHLGKAGLGWVTRNIRSGPDIWVVRDTLWCICYSLTFSGASTKQLLCIWYRYTIKCYHS